LNFDSLNHAARNKSNLHLLHHAWSNLSADDFDALTIAAGAFGFLFAIFAASAATSAAALQPKMNVKR
jgi:hypothetical protein